ncbi:MAG TPA: transposase family protein [Nitrososphaeraceae archaeon]|nr:transposase family protein [Nitrososphaeraceae archaeon]
MSYTRLSKRPLIFKSFTGLETAEFDIISKEIELKYYEHERKRLSNRKRQRDVGAGRPFKLKLRERFLMLLVYYRLYITYTLSGFLFDLDQSNVYRDISMLEPLIKLCVPLPKKLYRRIKGRLRTIDEVEEYFPGFKAFVDSTEQEIPRPTKNKRRRKSYYSGKKKKHTVKTQYMVNSEGAILHKTGHKHGRIHDYEIFKNNHPITPMQVESVFDLGYMGVQNDFPTVKSVLPVRKNKQRELSNEEKKYNRKHSKLRLIVEHTISRIKKFGIMGTKFRNRLGRYDHASDIVSGLVNFRIMMRTNDAFL